MDCVTLVISSDLWLYALDTTRSLRSRRSIVESVLALLSTLPLLGCLFSVMGISAGVTSGLWSTSCCYKPSGSYTAQTVLYAYSQQSQTCFQRSFAPVTVLPTILFAILMDRILRHALEQRDVYICFLQMMWFSRFPQIVTGLL